jgi:hypothetical protein
MVHRCGASIDGYMGWMLASWGVLGNARWGWCVLSMMWSVLDIDGYMGLMLAYWCMLGVARWGWCMLSMMWGVLDMGLMLAY